MKESIEEILKNLNSLIDLGKTLIELSLKAARECFHRILEASDQFLYLSHSKKLKVTHIRGRWISTPLGEVRVKRRRYIDEEGKSHYLLDELLGLAKRSPFLPEVKEIATFLSTLLPFRKSSQVMDKSLPQAAISSTTIHRLVKRATEPYLKQEELERKKLYEAGEVPVGEGKVVPNLFVEARIAQP